MPLFWPELQLYPTQYGTLIRITNGQEWLSTSKFVDSATNSMRVRYNEYMEALAAASSPAASVGGNTGSTVRPSSTPEDTGQRQLTVALAFQCTGSGAEQLLDALEQAGLRALLLFRPEELADNEAAIRRAVGSGHTIGLSIQETSAQQALEEAEQGSAWLEDYLRLRPHIVYLEGETARPSGPWLRRAGPAGPAAWTPGTTAGARASSAPPCCGSWRGSRAWSGSCWTTAKPCLPCCPRP